MEKVVPPSDAISDYEAGGFADENDTPISHEEAAPLIPGILRGLEDVAAGRVKPLAQVVAEARARHGFPSSWAAETSGFADENKTFVSDEEAALLRPGIERGLEAEAQGRYRPAADVFRDLEAKYGLRIGDKIDRGQAGRQ